MSSNLSRGLEVRSNREILSHGSTSSEPPQFFPQAPTKEKSLDSSSSPLVSKQTRTRRQLIDGGSDAGSNGGCDKMSSARGGSSDSVEVTLSRNSIYGGGNREKGRVGDGNGEEVDDNDDDGGDDSESSMAFAQQSSNHNNKSSSSSSSSRSSSLLASSSSAVFRAAHAPPRIGLENLGNTCFMNTSLQCLLHIEPLVSFFLKPDIKDNLSKVLNTSSPMKGSLASSFHSLVQDIHKTPSNKAVSPVNFMKAVATYAPYLMDFQQQDCQEFLRFLLDGMSEDLCRKKAPQFQQPAVVTSALSSSSEVISPGQGEDSHDRYVVATADEEEEAGDDLDDADEEQNDYGNSDGEIRPVVETGDKGSRGIGAASASLVVDDGDASGSTTSTNRYEFSRTAPLPVTSSTNGGNSKTNSIKKCNIDDLRVNVMRSFDTVEGPSSTDSPKLNISERLRQQVSANRQQAESGEDNNSSSKRKTSPEHRKSLPKKVGGSAEVPQLPEGPVLSPRSKALHEAHVAWARYLKFNDSIITDIFAGQLQSLIQCSTCGSKSCTYDPFLDLSVPIFRDTPSSESSSSSKCGAVTSPSHVPTPGVRGFLSSIRHAVTPSGPFPSISAPSTPTAAGKATARDSSSSSSSTSFSSSSTASSQRKADPSVSKGISLEQCLENFAAEEILDGDNMYFCESCKTRRRSTKKLSVFKFPKVLIIQIKRFRFNSSNQHEKLKTDVNFPLCGLDLAPYVSADSPTSVAVALAKSVGTGDLAIGGGAGAGGAVMADDPTSGEGGYVDLFGTRPVYDLVGVSNHHGNLHGGHYVAHCRVGGALSASDSGSENRIRSGGSVEKQNSDTSTAAAGNTTNHYSKTKLLQNDKDVERWLLFNDAHVSDVSADDAGGPTAYVLFYKLRDS